MESVNLYTRMGVLIERLVETFTWEVGIIFGIDGDSSDQVDIKGFTRLESSHENRMGTSVRNACNYNS